MKSKKSKTIRSKQTMRVKPLIQLIGCALLPAGFVGAEGISQELETVTVTASGYAQNIVSAPASISVVRAAELNQKPYYSLMDAVRSVEGVGMAGGEKGDITIRGMPSSSTLILIDGRRQNSTRELNPKGGISVEDNWTPPINAIHRIEVIRGPMSSLYGSDAMGGVINIITKKVNDRWSGSVGMQTTVQENSKSGNHYLGNFYVSGPLVTDKLGLQLWGQKSYRAEDKIVGGFDKANSIGGNARIWWTPTQDQDFMLEMNNQKQKYLGSREKTVNPNGKTKLTARNYSKQSFTFAHNARWELGDSKFSYIYDSAKRETFSDGKTDMWMPKTKNHTLDGSFIAPIGESNMLTMGGQWRQHSLDIDGMRNGKLPPLPNGLPATGKVNAKIKQWAIFVEDTWEVSDRLALTGGLRFDDNQIFGHHLSPRAYANWSLNDHWTIKGGIASGFVPPSMKEYVPYIGNGQRGGATTWGNPDLKPETSLNREIGLYYDNAANFSANLTYFNTNYRDKIANTGSKCLDGPSGTNANADGCWTGADGKPMSVYFNIPKAMIQGLEFATHWKINSSFKLNAHYTYTDSNMKTAGAYIYGFDLDQSNGLAPVATPKHMANAQFDWKIKDNMSTYASVNYRGKDNRSVSWGGGGRPMNEGAGSLTTFDFGYSWNVNKNIAINTGIKNIFNNSNYDPQRKGVYQYVEDGRRYWLSLEGKF